MNISMAKPQERTPLGATGWTVVKFVNDGLTTDNRYGTVAVTGPNGQHDSFTWRATHTAGTWSVHGSGAKINGKTIPNPDNAPFKLDQDFNRALSAFIRAKCTANQAKPSGATGNPNPVNNAGDSHPRPSGEGNGDNLYGKDTDVTKAVEVFRSLSAIMRKTAYLFAQGYSHEDINRVGDIAHGTVGSYLSQLPGKLSQPREGFREFLQRLFKHDPSLCADITAELEGGGGGNADEKIFDELAPHEVNLFAFLAQETSVKEIAERTEETETAVNASIRQLLEKFSCTETSELVARVRLFIPEKSSGDDGEKPELSEAERPFAALLLKGLLASQIAAQLNIKLRQVEATLEALLRRFECDTVQALVEKLRPLFGTEAAKLERAAQDEPPTTAGVAPKSGAEATTAHQGNGVPDAVLLERAITKLRGNLPGFKVTHGFSRTGGVTTLSRFTVEEQGRPQSGNGEALLVAVEEFGAALPHGFELEFETDNDGNTTKLTRIEIKKKA